MALRSLDNALPIITPERLKKQTKIVNFSKKQSDEGINDENKAPINPTPVDAAIDYISSENLKALPDPQIKIKGLIEGLDSKDWMKVCDSLNTVRRIALYHSHLLLPLLEKVMVVLVKAMKNPRSALIKTSIMASSDIFTAFGDNILPVVESESTTSANAFDQFLLQLLLKGSQDKKFVCEEADRALNAMVENMTPLLLMHKLRAYVSHSNPRIRAKAAVFMSTCTSKLGMEGMKEFGLVAMIEMGAHLLNDRLPEAREAARVMVGSIYKAVVTTTTTTTEDYNEKTEEEKQEGVWQAFCEANLSAFNAQAVAKVAVLVSPQN